VPITGGDPELVASDAAFPVPLADGSVAVVSGLRGFRDGQNPTISIVDANRGATELVVAQGDVWQPRLSPDGTRLAFVTADRERDAGQLRVVDIATGEITIAGPGDLMDWLDDDTLVVGTYDT
jgi:dipeptidyl aminopeptidase/acylaminoacyl peptidase